MPMFFSFDELANALLMDNNSGQIAVFNRWKKKRDSDEEKKPVTRKKRILTAEEQFWADHPELSPELFDEDGYDKDSESVRTRSDNDFQTDDNDDEYHGEDNILSYESFTEKDLNSDRTDEEQFFDDVTEAAEEEGEEEAEKESRREYHETDEDEWDDVIGEDDDDDDEDDDKDDDDDSDPPVRKTSPTNNFRRSRWSKYI